MTEQPRLVLVAGDLLLDLVDRANPGQKFEVEWGEPNTVTVLIYEPVFRRLPMFPDDGEGDAA